MSFPVLEVLHDVKQALRDHPMVILQAPPGAGKSTVLPLHLIQESWLADRKIIMLEPRRLAARSVAHRMADALGEEPGNSVGYTVRVENTAGAVTRLQVCTAGAVRRLAQCDST